MEVASRLFPLVEELADSCRDTPQPPLSEEFVCLLVDGYRSMILGPGGRDRAIERFEQCLVLDSTAVLPRLYLGELLSKRGHLDLAYRHLLIVVEQQPCFRRALLELGDLSLRRGMPMNAIAYWSQAARETQVQAVRDAALKRMATAIDAMQE